MIPNIYSSSDYAGIETGKFHFYYGFEVTDPETDDWCFIVKKNGKEVYRLRNSELLAITHDGGPKDMLMAGIALYLSK